MFRIKFEQKGIKCNISKHFKVFLLLNKFKHVKIFVNFQKQYLFQ